MNIGDFRGFLNDVDIKDEADMQVFSGGEYKDVTIAEYRQDSDGNLVLILEIL